MQNQIFISLICIYIYGLDDKVIQVFFLKYYKTNKKSFKENQKINQRYNKEHVALLMCVVIPQFFILISMRLTIFTVYIL